MMSGVVALLQQRMRKVKLCTVFLSQGIFMEAVAVIRLALKIISDRLILILALALSFSLACWTMYDPNLERLGTMAFFSIFSYLLLNIRKREPYEKSERLADQE